MASNPTPRRTAGPDAPGDATPVEVVRSEERLRVGTEVRVTGRAVLRRYVVTETVTQTFQVRREEVRLEHEPVSGTAAEGDRPAFADGVAAEVVLHREVPRVVMDVVPVERVRLHVATVTEQVPVTADLRRERVALDPPVDRLP